LLIRPGEFPLGSVESRAAARVLAKEVPLDVLRVTIVHIGKRDAEGLPLPAKVNWPGGITEIVHIPGSAE
jgi:hypothetical protein